MLPLQDLNPARRFPILTFTLIAINVLVFGWQMTLTHQELVDAYRTLAVVPANITDAPFALETLLDIVRSMFMHGGVEHIFGNMLYLYLFGDNIEDRCGRLLFAGMYFLSGFVAVFAQVMIAPDSTVPMIGASGAVAGVLGSYLIFFPTVRVRGIIPIGFYGLFAEWPAFIVLGLWFVLQLFSGVASLGAEYSGGGGVAFFAHIGGFLTGIAITLILMAVREQPKRDDRQSMLYERAKHYRW